MAEVGGLQNLAIFSDCLVAVHLVQGDISVRSEVASWLEDILVLKGKFDDVFFDHISRKQNCLADILAKKACYNDVNGIWKDNFPSWLLNTFNKGVSFHVSHNGIFFH